MLNQKILRNLSGFGAEHTRKAVLVNLTTHPINKNMHMNVVKIENQPMVRIAINKSTLIYFYSWMIWLSKNV